MIKKSNSGVRWQDGSYDPYQERYKEVVTKKSYWNWVEENSPQDETGVYIESPMANADVLADATDAQPVLTEDQDDMRNAAYDQLSPRQKEVWDLAMREGRPQSEVAERLSISQPAVCKLLNAAKLVFMNHVRLAQEQARG